MNTEMYERFESCPVSSVQLRALLPESPVGPPEASLSKGLTDNRPGAVIKTGWNSLWSSVLKS